MSWRTMTEYAYGKVMLILCRDRHGNLSFVSSDKIMISLVTEKNLTFVEK